MGKADGQLSKKGREQSLVVHIHDANGSPEPINQQQQQSSDSDEMPTCGVKRKRRIIESDEDDNVTLFTSKRSLSQRDTSDSEISSVAACRTIIPKKRKMVYGAHGQPKSCPLSVSISVIFFV